MFIDEATILVKAGDGGDGCVSFRREKFIPKGGPDGGNGGKGGDILIETDPQKTTLLDFRYKSQYKADRGQHGQGKNMYGRGSEDLIIKVPLGTIIKNFETDEVIEDMTEPGQQIVIAKGGKGGRGNNSFKSSIRQAPKFAEKGTPGEEFKIKLELKLIADVGLVGFPNSGKSTFLSKVSAAKPKIADYPFTTKAPILGIANVGFRTFAIADIPGLIEGAHNGTGLGDKFLKHIERTKIIIHIVDLAGVDGRTPLSDFKTINNELKQFNKSLAEKTQVVALNKIDLPDAKKNLAKVQRSLKKKGIESFAISAATGEGLEILLKKVAQKL